ARMQLVQVDPVGPKPAQTRLTGPADVAGADVHAATGPALLIEDQAELGGDHDLVAHAGKGLAEHAFAVAAAVHVGSVEQADPKVDAPPDSGGRLLVVDLAPAGGLPVGLPWSPNRPAAEPQRADRPSAAPQGAGHRHVSPFPSRPGPCTATVPQPRPVADLRQCRGRHPTAVAIKQEPGASWSFLLLRSRRARLRHRGGWWAQPHRGGRRLHRL